MSEKLWKTTRDPVRFIRQGHACLGVSDPAGLTLTAGDGNHSLLWSRNAGQGSGNTHVWSPYGKGETTDGLPGFNGERPDPVSGSYHLGNGYRAYNPLLRRFNCPDSLSPFGAGGINPYAYCLGDPVNRTDPTGHISWQGVVGIVTGAIGLGLSLFTAGTSIAAAGSMTAALSSVSRLGLAIGLMGMAADVTAIASGAAEDVDPQASAVLGWVSMATGIAGVGIGTKLAAGRATQSVRQRLGNIRDTGLSGRGGVMAAHNWGNTRRAVIVQGTYGVFSTERLNLSMPAVQTCIGVYAEDSVNKILMAAHFDSNISLKTNLKNIMQSMENSGMNSLSTNVRVFGGDNYAAYLRCGKPSKYIGDDIVSHFRAAGYDSAYTEYYSGLLPHTFDYTFHNASRVSYGGMHTANFAFRGVGADAMAFFRERTVVPPHAYTLHSALMLDLSHSY